MDTAVIIPTTAEVDACVADGFPGSWEAGTRCTGIGPGWAEAERPARVGDIRPGGIISGPALFGLADAVLWFGCFAVIGIEPMALTSELSIRFLRPGRGEVVRARADMDHVGGRSLVGTVRVWVDDRRNETVAVAQGTYVRPRRT